MKKYAKLRMMQEARNESRMGAEYRMEGRYENRMETGNRYMEPESRRRYDNGRFAPSNRYEGGSDMNTIGFNTEGNGFRNEYRGGGDERYDGGGRMDSNRSYPPEYRRSPSMHYGGDYQAQFSVKPMHGEQKHGGTHRQEFDEHTARKWVKSMQRADGEKGEKWSVEDVQKLMQKYGIKHDPIKVYVAMNAEYADRCEVNKRYGITSPEYYMESAIAFWLEDEDAVPDKMEMYYECIVQK